MVRSLFFYIVGRIFSCIAKLKITTLFDGVFFMLHGICARKKIRMVRIYLYIDIMKFNIL